MSIMYQGRFELGHELQCSVSAPDADDRHGRHTLAQCKLQPPSQSHCAQGSLQAGVGEGSGISQSGQVPLVVSVLHSVY
jgi:hypothetical protein